MDNEDFNAPDFLKGDYYCKLCDSHMNSQGMWESHIIGKRHLTNMSKAPNETLSKVKCVPLNVCPLIINELKQAEMDEPIIGLKYTCETRRADVTVDPLYKCYICSGTYVSKTFIEHLLSLKHRVNYLKKMYPKEMTQVDALRLNNSQYESIISEMSLKDFNENGRGIMEVKIEKTPGECIIKSEFIKPEPSQYSFFRKRNKKSTYSRSFNTYQRPISPPPLFGPIDIPGPSRIKKEVVKTPSSSSSDSEFDIEKDYKCLKPKHINAIIDIEADEIKRYGVEAASHDKHMASISKHCLKLELHSLINNTFNKGTHEQRKKIKFALSKEGQQKRLKKQKKALHVPDSSKK